MGYKTGTGYTLAGPIEDAVEKAIFGGKPGSKGVNVTQRQDFYAGVLSKSGQRFVKSPEGKSTINKFAIYAAIPAFAAGFFVAYLVYRKKEGSKK